MVPRRAVECGFMEGYEFDRVASCCTTLETLTDLLDHLGTIRPPLQLRGQGSGQQREVVPVSLVPPASRAGEIKRLMRGLEVAMWGGTDHHPRPCRL